MNEISFLIEFKCKRSFSDAERVCLCNESETISLFIPAAPLTLYIQQTARAGGQ